jgi:ABC-2 type transport system ATP-binding protein
MKNLRLEVKNISKNFGEQTAVSDVSFDAAGGEVLGILGPAGAGKTSILRMLMNLTKMDSGEIFYDGAPYGKRVSALFGYLPEERGLYPEAKVLDTLIYLGSLKKMPYRKAEVEAIRHLDRLGMVDYTDTAMNLLAKGMQQKVQFIAPLVHNPEVVIFDEPFAELDPINHSVLHNILNECKKKGKIIIISTRHMNIAEQYCDHICMLNQAKIILAGKPTNLKKEFQENAYFIATESPMPFFKELKEIEVLEEKNDAYKFCLKGKKGSINSILDLVKDKTKLVKFEIVEPTLHDIFLKRINN